MNGGGCEERKVLCPACKGARYHQDTFDDLGLGYLELRRPPTVLSGGEAQRVKLAGELRKLERGKHDLSILDEPAPGLRCARVDRLLVRRDRLVDNGRSLGVIEAADHVVDLGPEGGHEAGWLSAGGTPKQVAARKATRIGKALSALPSPHT